MLSYCINPSLLTPNYELFLLYQEMEDIEKMIEIGNKALNQPLKREGTETLTMKANIKNILYNLSSD
ncbi:MAG: hypothetical protein LIO65_06030 [Odoribacter sp.]|nr:hypothetical protein [Odoribacter sp.]